MSNNRALSCTNLFQNKNKWLGRTVAVIVAKSWNKYLLRQASNFICFQFSSINSHGIPNIPAIEIREEKNTNSRATGIQRKLNIGGKQKAKLPLHNNIWVHDWVCHSSCWACFYGFPKGGLPLLLAKVWILHHLRSSK